jgi:spermidine synthase
MLGLVFGHTVFALTTVLAAFMGGLALGASVFGRMIDRRGRPLRVYGLLESGIGLYALIVPFLLDAARVVYLQLYRSFEMPLAVFTVAQFVLISAILLIPATLMGASLPVLVKLFAGRLEGIGRRVGNLYALNTAGAVVGSAAAGFLLLPVLGVQRTTLLAAAINLVIGLWAILADVWGDKFFRVSTAPARDPLSSTTENPPATASPPLLIALVLAGIGLSGAASMVYEVAWTRALRLMIGSSIYAFSAMLTTFLVGLSLGSFLFARLWGNRKTGAALFGWIELAIGLSALALVPAFERLPDLVLAIFNRLSPSYSGAVMTQFALSFLVMIVPTTLIGAAFPCAVQIYARSSARLGRDVGQTYSVNTLGTIIGVLCAGFVLVPWIGTQASMTTAAAINAIVGTAILLISYGMSPAWPRLLVYPLVLLFVLGTWLLPRWDPSIMAGGVSVYVSHYVSGGDPTGKFREERAGKELLFYREGLNSTVSVERTARNTSLRVDGKTDASDGIDMATQLMLGHLPMLLHPNPERALVIGLGSGVTVGAMLQHSVLKDLEIIELEPAVIEASIFFRHVNRDFRRDPRVRIEVADGRNFLLASEEKYDVISSEPSNPWIAGVANLFSREFYELARSRLDSDGMMVQWIHGYSLFPRELQMVVNTFRSVFSHVTVWWGSQGDYLLVGTKQRLVVDYGRLVDRYESSKGVRTDFEMLGWRSPLALLTLFLLDDADSARYAKGAPINSDDHPLLEFAAPLALYVNTIEENHRLLKAASSRSDPPVEGLAKGSVWSPKLRLEIARVFWTRGDKEGTLDQLHKIAVGNPPDLEVLFERAKLLMVLGRMADAAADLEQVLNEKPKEKLATSYLKVARLIDNQSLESSFQVHGISKGGLPNLAEAHNNLGKLYISIGLRMREPAAFDLAADSFKAALQVEPQSYQFLNNLGNAYFEQGLLHEAVATYRRVLRINPKLAGTHLNLGVAYERQGALALAAQEFEAAIALDSNWSLPRTRLTQLCQRPGRSKKSHRAGKEDRCDVWLKESIPKIEKSN